MRAVVWLLALAAAPAVRAQTGTGDVVYYGRTFGSDPIPSLDKGYLLYLQHHGRISVYGPDGRLVFDTTVLDSGGSPASVSSAATDSDGTVAVTTAHPVPEGYGGGIAFLDAAGKQVRLVATGRYMPMQLCFDADHFLWAFGWQRGADRNHFEDTQDYFQVRKFSKDGLEVGRYLPRSLFSTKLSPFSAHRGLWWARAAGDRIGAFARSSDSGGQSEWVELDLQGRLIGRWPVGRIPHGGHAYTADGRLFSKTMDARTKSYRLLLFDRTTLAWTPVADLSTGETKDFAQALLLGASGNDLVFAMQSGSQLITVPAGRFPDARVVPAGGR
jgi:hypothetical protein